VFRSFCEVGIFLNFYMAGGSDSESTISDSYDSALGAFGGKSFYLLKLVRPRIARHHAS
jgi:hypothetical protein